MTDETNLRVAARYGLPNVRTTVAATTVLTAKDVAVAAEQRIEGLVWAATLAGVIKANGEVLTRVRDAYLHALSTCLLAEEVALRAFDALDGASVEARALKGVAIAHLDHRDPGERMFGDADLLIRRVDYDRAFGALTAAGFRRVHPPVRGWWEHRFGRAVTLKAPNGGELDVHLAIAGGYFGERIDHARLWASASETFDLGGRPTLGLDPRGRLLHACCHVVLGGGSGLRGRRDVAQLLLVSDVDWQAVVADGIRDGVDGVLAAAIHDTWCALYLDDQQPAAMGCRPCGGTGATNRASRLWIVDRGLDPRGAQHAAGARHVGQGSLRGWARPAVTCQPAVARPHADGARSLGRGDGTPEQTPVTALRYTRTPRILWRGVGDQLLTRRADDASFPVEAQLAGLPALVWLALGEPRTRAELLAVLDRTVRADASEVDAAVALLLQHGLIAAHSS